MQTTEVQKVRCILQQRKSSSKCHMAGSLLAPSRWCFWRSTSSRLSTISWCRKAYNLWTLLWLSSFHWTIEPLNPSPSCALACSSSCPVEVSKRIGKMAKSLFHPALCREKSLEKWKPHRHRASVRGLIGPESMAASGKRPIATSLISDGSQWGQMAMPPPHPFEWRLSANVAEPEEGKRLATRLAVTDGSLISPLRHWRVAGFAACWAPKVLLVWETYKNIKNPWGAQGVDQPTSWNTNGFEMDTGMDQSSWYFSQSLLTKMVCQSSRPIIFHRHLAG